MRGIHRQMRLSAVSPMISQVQSRSEKIHQRVQRFHHSLVGHHAGDRYDGNLTGGPRSLDGQLDTAEQAPGKWPRSFLRNRQRPGRIRRAACRNDAAVALQLRGFSSGTSGLGGASGRGSQDSARAARRSRRGNPRGAWRHAPGTGRRSTTPRWASGCNRRRARPSGAELGVDRARYSSTCRL